MQAGAIGDRHNRDLGLPVQCAPPMRSPNALLPRTAGVTDRPIEVGREVLKSA